MAPVCVRLCVLASVAGGAAGMRHGHTDGHGGYSEEAPSLAEALGRRAPSSAHRCASLAQRLFAAARPAFEALARRPYVGISDDGQIKLRKLARGIPFELCDAILSPGPMEHCPKVPKINKAKEHVTRTLSDLKKLLDTVGAKHGRIVGLAGGTNLGPKSGKHPEWAGQWRDVAKARAETMAAELGLQGRVETAGEWTDFGGVRIQVTALMKISALRGPGGGGPPCEGPDASPGEVVEGARRILSRGNLRMGGDESVVLRKFVQNNIPFRPCRMSTTSLEKRLGQIGGCISAAGVADEGADGVRAAARDVVDLAGVVGATRLQIKGFTNTSAAFDDERDAAKVRSLAAARAEVLVKALQAVDTDNVLGQHTSRLLSEMEACRRDGSPSACNEVVGSGKIAVDIHMETFMNPDALG